MFSEILLTLTRQLYPTGRAYKMPVGGVLEALHKALAISENTAYENGIGLLNSILPDNTIFTVEDATVWEYRLGLINSGASLSDRKLAISRKINYPSTVRVRHNYRYLEAQLRAAGFDVYVHENRFSVGGGAYFTKTPLHALPSIDNQLGDNQLGDSQLADEASFYSALFDTQTIQLGDFQLGDFQLTSILNLKNKVANSIDSDRYFQTGENYKSTFFICGATLGTFANVQAIRKNEFRELIMKLKPVQTVAFLYTNYI